MLSAGPGAQDEARLIKALGEITAGYEKVGNLSVYVMRRDALRVLAL